jgi:SPP1 family predicted phage head-tail adaptor
MNAGKLRHRIQIQAVTLTPDGMGSGAESWATIAGGSVWAEILPLRGVEAIQAGQLEAKLSHKVRIRYLAGVTAKHRILFGSRVFKIHEVRNLEERGVMLELMCEDKT